MKKSHFVSILSILLMVGIVAVLMVLWTMPDVLDEVISPPLLGTSEPSPVTPPPVTDPDETNGGNTAIVPRPEFTMENSLFVGDSRAVGLKEYAGIDGVEWFCDVGMSSANLEGKSIAVGTREKMSLDELLQETQYRKIYLMMGINEVGNHMPTTVQKHRELVERILQLQPDAEIFIQANLHVSKIRNDRGDSVNNAAIDRLNSQLSEIAEKERVYYMDVNPIFDDATHSLRSDATGDGVHPYAKHYAQWGNWIIAETRRQTGY